MQSIYEMNVRTSRERLHWKTAMLEKFSQRYGELSPDHHLALHNLLDRQWQMSVDRASSSLGRIAGTVLACISNFMEVPLALPDVKIIAILGRATFMGLSYLAGCLLSAEVLKQVVGPLEKLEEKHLECLFKKADDVETLIQVLGTVNLDFESALSKQKQAVLVSGVGIFAGRAVAQHRHRAGIPGLCSLLLPKAWDPEHDMFGRAAKNHFEKKLMEDNPGLRHRPGAGPGDV